MVYLLFAGNDYYPSGGAGDLRGRFDSVEEAVAKHDPSKFMYDGGWAHVFCLDTMEIVKLFDRGTWYDAKDFIP